jgi:hypothetical protein
MKRSQQNSTESTLKLHQTSVIAALMRGATVTEATKQADVDRSTYYVWLKSDANFAAELDRAKREQAESMRAQLRGLADTAIATLREILTGKDVAPAVRLKAALSVLQGTGALEPETIGKTDPQVPQPPRLIVNFLEPKNQDPYLPQEISDNGNNGNSR